VQSDAAVVQPPFEQVPLRQSELLLHAAVMVAVW
jgi:hypothetical protein